MSTVDTLLGLGLVKFTESEPDRTHVPSNAPLKDDFSTPALLANVSLAGRLRSAPDALFAPAPVQPELSQPPLFWKAFALALKSKFTTSSNLYADGRALFIAEPNQAGIPAASGFPEQVTNYHMFIKADTMQVLNKPTFALEGSSYFEFLNSYLIHITTADESQAANEARLAYESAQAEKDQIWERLCDEYKDQYLSKTQSSQPSLIEYLNEHTDYVDAWNREGQAKLTYEKVRKPMPAVDPKVEAMRKADARMVENDRYNMAVIADTGDFVYRKFPERTIDPKLLYYRPLYNLPGFETTVIQWNAFWAQDPEATREQVAMPLAVWDRKWKTLGHPLLDEVEPSEILTPAQKDYIMKLDATITFLYQPSAVDVFRGPWDISDLRKFRREHPLPASAPDDLKAPICKTTSLIMTWGIEIELKLPDPLPADTVVENLTLTVLDLPLAKVSDDKRKLAFRSSYNGFPILLASLTRIV